MISIWEVRNGLEYKHFRSCPKAECYFTANYSDGKDMGLYRIEVTAEEYAKIKFED